MSINNELHRDIKDGSQFNKYFEKVSGNVTFEKNGDTTEVLHVMHKDALKFAYQTKKIAQILKGNTVEQTVDNIYNFLYNHVQYNIDGINQNLRSPASSWQERKTGIDCKSYSIFASTILLNLGIEHSFRKVKQKYYQPKYWTHVYVVVKTNNGQFVIDPTVKVNEEVPIVKKKDIKVSKLPIYTLNAGVQAPAQLTNRDSEILNGFNELTNFFHKIGVSTFIINAVHQKVQNAYYKHNGFDFPFKLLPNDVLLIDGDRIELLPNGLNAGIDLSMFSTGGGGLNTTLATTAAPTGVNTGGSGILSLLTSVMDPTGGLLTGLLGTLNIQENISNVLQYGLSSWGASTSPEKAKAQFNEKAVPYVQGLLQGMNDSNFVSNINEVEKYLTFIIALETHKLKDHSRAESTKQGRKQIIELATKLREDSVRSVISQLRLKGANVVTKKQRANNSSITYQWSPTDNSFHGDGGFDYNVYQIAIPASLQITQSTTQPTVTAPAAPKLDASGNIIPPKSESNTTKIIGYVSAAALAAFVVVPMITNKDKKK